MKKKNLFIGSFLCFLITSVLLYQLAWTFPPTPSSSYNPAAVNETGGNITGITNFSASNLTVSGIANVTGATWQGTPTWNQDTTGNAANAAALNGHADTYFQTALTGASDLTVGNITVGSVANITSFTGTGISDSTSTTASNVAASSTAVKAAYDLANGKLSSMNIDIAAFAWDGGSSAISNAIGKVCRYVKYASTIVGASLIMDAASNTTVVLYKDAFNATVLPTTDWTGGNAVNSVGNLGMVDNTLTGWTTTSISAGDVICANMDTNDTAKRATLILHGTR
jgi:hypothetical protein